MDIQLNSKPIKWQQTIENQVMDWGIKALHVYDIWKETRGAGIKVAVLDTGIIDHPDLKINIKGGVNFTSDNRKDYTDRVGHGTHCAGIIAAADNEIGVVGVAPMAEIYAVKVLGDDGSGSFDMIVKGIEWAIKHNMDIISMSLGCRASSEELHKAIKKAHKHNITIVAAAGNEGDENPDNDMSYPARYPETIAVGSVNKYFKRSWFSSDGEELDIMAPGQDIYSTYLDNKYAILSGTSMATPFVTGVVALLLSKHKNTKDNKTPVDTPAKIREHLIRTADDAGEIGRDNFYGYGIISPKKFLEGVNVMSLYPEVYQEKPASAEEKQASTEEKK